MTRLTASGPDRFARVAAAWRELTAGAVADAAGRPARRRPRRARRLRLRARRRPRAALVRLRRRRPDRPGGRARPPRRRRPPHARRPRRARRRPGGARRRASPPASPRCASTRCRCSTRRPSAASGSTPSRPPEHYEAAVARAVERIRAGEPSRRSSSPARSPSRRPRRTTPPRSSASCAPASSPATSSAPAAATPPSSPPHPELLIRRDGHRAQTVALAGSTRRSADPAVDDHLGEQLLRSDKDREEQAIVVRRIARALRPHAVWVAAPDEPDPHQGREHPAPRHPDPRPARPPARRRSSSPASSTQPPPSAANPTPPPPPSSRPSKASTEAGTPEPSAGPTPTTTASSASPSAAPSSEAPKPASTRASASSATPTQPPSSTRPRSSSAPSSRSSPASRRRGHQRRSPRRLAAAVARGWREVGGVGRVDRQGDLAGVMRATSGASTKRGPSVGLDDDAVEDVLAGVVEDAVDGAELDAVGGDDRDAAGEGLVADLGVVVGGQGAES